MGLEPVTGKLLGASEILFLCRLAAFFFSFLQTGSCFFVPKKEFVQPDFTPEFTYSSLIVSRSWMTVSKSL
jgi:hypothetical protein